MDLDISKSFTRIKTKIDKGAHESNRKANEITLIAVSKQQQEDRIDASLAIGHRVFGENRVQGSTKTLVNPKI